MLLTNEVTGAILTCKFAFLRNVEKRSHWSLFSGRFHKSTIPEPTILSTHFPNNL